MCSVLVSRSTAWRHNSSLSLLFHSYTYKLIHGNGLGQSTCSESLYIRSLIAKLELKRFEPANTRILAGFIRQSPEEPHACYS
jgi:hypothetical protein